jgi:hypothetical protein
LVDLDFALVQVQSIGVPRFELKARSF